MRYNRKANYHSVPFSVNISVTEKCPLKCPMCFQPYDEKAELDINVICKHLDELSLMGTKIVQFSGGEPLVYPHLLEAISYAKKQEMRVLISTSGFGLTKEMAISLKNSGLDCCYVSLNGSKAYIHELVRDRFEDAVKAIEILPTANIRTLINWVANHENVRDLSNLVELAKSYDVKGIILLLNKKSNSGEKLYPLTQEDLHLLKEQWHKNSDYLGIESCFFQLLNLVKPNSIAKTVGDGCRAGRFHMALSARNEFLPCPHVNKPSKTTTSVRDYWNNNIELRNIRQMLKMNQCFTCNECTSKGYYAPCYIEISEFNERETCKKRGV